jgi:hypothetical protein
MLGNESVTQTATINATLNDGTASGPPSPTGVTGVNLNVYQYGTTSFSANIPFWDPISAETSASGGRNYLIADTGWPTPTPSSVTVVSHWNYILLAGDQGNFNLPPTPGAAGNTTVTDGNGAVSIPNGARDLTGTTVTLATGSILLSSSISASQVDVRIERIYDGASTPRIRVNPHPRRED